MSTPRRLRLHEYVSRPFTDVRELLRARARDVFQAATQSAASRASAVAASLHAVVAGLEVGVDVRMHVHSVRDEKGVAGMSPLTRIALGWEAVSAPALFPVMSAELSLWPLTSTETQLEIEGAYRPPLGPVGNAIDAAIGHRLAEAVVHRFLDDVVEQIKRDLPERK